MYQMESNWHTTFRSFDISDQLKLLAYRLAYRSKKNEEEEEENNRLCTLDKKTIPTQGSRALIIQQTRRGWFSAVPKATEFGHFSADPNSQVADSAVFRKLSRNFRIFEKEELNARYSK